MSAVYKCIVEFINIYHNAGPLSLLTRTLPVVITMVLIIVIVCVTNISLSKYQSKRTSIKAKRNELLEDGGILLDIDGDSIVHMSGSIRPMFKNHDLVKAMKISEETVTAMVEDYVNKAERDYKFNNTLMCENLLHDVDTIVENRIK